MDYKQERLRQKWTLKQVSEKIGKSVAAINGLEKHDDGGFELRFLLRQLYTGQTAGLPQEIQRESQPCPRCASAERRALAAEQELAALKAKLKGLV